MSVECNEIIKAHKSEQEFIQSHGKDENTKHRTHDTEIYTRVPTLLGTMNNFSCFEDGLGWFKGACN